MPASPPWVPRPAAVYTLVPAEADPGAAQENGNPRGRPPPLSGDTTGERLSISGLDTIGCVHAPFPVAIDNLMTSSDGEITRLMARWSDGDDEAFDRLIGLVYDDLRAIAHRHLMAGPRDAVLDTTGLVHEAYLKLCGAGEGEWPGRAQFFAFCSKVMRRLLIDFARKRQSQKRGGARVRVTLGDDTAVVESEVLELLAVEEVLQKLEARSPRMARIVECRFFGGMSVAETAEALETSVRTVERDWSRARTYLRRDLEGGARG